MTELICEHTLNEFILVCMVKTGETHKLLELLASESAFVTTEISIRILWRNAHIKFSDHTSPFAYKSGQAPPGIHFFAISIPLDARIGMVEKVSIQKKKLK